MSCRCRVSKGRGEYWPGQRAWITQSARSCHGRSDDHHRAETGHDQGRKSIANFKLREGRIIGTKVTLRGDKMWAFLDRLMNTALPRVRDFRGVSPDAFDGRGNYTLGLRDQLIFPEIEYDKIDKVRGMEVTIVTTAKSDDHARLMLQLLGMPFKKEE